MSRFPLVCLALTAATFIAAPLFIQSVESKLNAIESRMEARYELVNQVIQ